MAGIPSLAALEGLWTVSRRVQHSDGRVDTFEGRADFRRSGGRLVQQEEGIMTPGRAAQGLRATRSYIWSANEGRLDVAFDDMRPFHSVPLGADIHETVHLCDPDRYQVAYDLRDFPTWSTVWTVEGPRKSYVMTSHFTRRAAV